MNNVKQKELLHTTSFLKVEKRFFHYFSYTHLIYHLSLNDISNHEELKRNGLPVLHYIYWYTFWYVEVNNKKKKA